MILLFTDFGLEGSYLGEMTAALRRTSSTRWQWAPTGR